MMCVRARPLTMGRRHRRDGARTTTGWRASIHGGYRAALFPLVFLMADAAPAEAQASSPGSPRHFSGAFVSTNVGSQNVFSGALINNIDVLAQDGRRVLEISGGLRRQLLGGRFLVGAEVQYGFTNGDLLHFDAPSQSTVSYANDAQKGLGLIAGYVAGPDASVALFAYAFSTERTFDISIEDAMTTYQQTDGEAFLRYGLGMEARVSGAWHADVSVGRQTLDFGDKITNVELEQKLDLTVGVTFQF